MLTKETGIGPDGKRFIIFRGSRDEISEASASIRAHTRETHNTTFDDVPKILRRAKVRTRGPICSKLAVTPVGQHRRAPSSQGTRQRGSRRTTSGSSPPSDPDESDPASGRVPCSTCRQPLPAGYKGKTHSREDDPACRRLYDRQRQQQGRIERRGRDVAAEIASAEAAKPDVYANLADIECFSTAIKLGRAAGCYETWALEEMEAHLGHLYEVRRQIKIRAGYVLDGSNVRAATFVGTHPKPRATKAWKRDRRRKSTTPLADRQAGALMVEVAA